MVKLEEIEKRLIFIESIIEKDEYHFILKNYNTNQILYINNNNIMEMAKYVEFFVKGHIFIGFDLKSKVLHCFFEAVLNLKPPNMIYNISQNPKLSNLNVWMSCEFTDMRDFTKVDRKLIYANKGLNVRYEDPETTLKTYVDNLKYIYDIEFREELDTKMYFQKFNPNINEVLKTKTTSILAKAMANNYKVDYTGEGEYFEIPDRFVDYFNRNLPIDIILSFTSCDAANFKEFKKGNPKVFEIDLFDNPGKTGNGGYHSFHKHITSFSDKYYGDYVLNPKDYKLFHDDGDAYYPNIMTINDVISRNADLPFFVQIKEDRAEMKKTDPKSKATLVLKIAANGIYGQGGFANGPLYDPWSQMAITALGQMIIIAYSNALYKLGCVVYQANTDGVYVAVPNDKLKEYYLLQKEVSDISGIKFDSDELSYLYQSNVNNYIKVYKNGKVEVKGSTSSLCGDYMNDQTDKKTYAIVSKAVYEYLLNDVPVIDTIWSNSYDISWYVLTCGKNNYDAVGIANRTNKLYGLDDKFMYTNIAVDKVNAKGARFTGWDIHYIFKNEVVRLLPVNSGGIKCYLFKDGKTPESVKGQNHDNIYINDLTGLNKSDFDIDYEFLVKEAEKRIRKVIKNYDYINR